MKKKLMVSTILMIFIFSLIFNFYNVQAYSGELDPKGYISLPMRMNMSNGVAQGTITLSSSASDYSIAYQKVDMTQSQYNAIINKYEEIEEYVEENKNILKEKEANVTTLQTEYQTLANSGTATEEQINEAYNKYHAAVQEYNQFLETAQANLTKLQNEYYAAIPNYTNSWIDTTNTSNNVKVDFGNKTGMIYFVLWAKITNGTNTYYDMNIYSNKIEEQETVTINKSSASIKVDETVQLNATSSKGSNITWTSSDNSVATVSADGLVKGIKEGSAVITAKGSEKTVTCTVTVTAKATTTPTPDTEDDTAVEWTDFSNAKIELKKDGISGAFIQISNITPNSDSNYYLFISNKQDINVDNLDGRLIMHYDNESKGFKVLDNSGMIANHVELNQDVFVSIVEEQSYDNSKVVVSGKKLEKYDEPKYSDAFFATFLAEDMTQIVTTFTHSEKNNRKMQIKVGEITDISILNKIKNKDSSGFASLLSFAKSNNGILNKTVDADKDDFYAIEYNASTNQTNGNSVINIKGLKDDAYYFLYVKVDDENGKYVTQEGVSLAQAWVLNDGNWSLNFYGTDSFEWADFSVATPDDTVAGGKLPQTGENIIIFSTLGVLAIGIAVSVAKLKKYNF